MTLAEAGLLLAANRLVRIFGYSHVMRFYARRGDRPVCVLAAATAALCALGYATLSGFWWLLLLRLGWGLTYAALNLSTQVMATAEPTGAARRTGRSRALIATGPMLALPLGALVSVEYGPRVIFLLMALTSLVALLLPSACRASPIHWPVPAAASGVPTAWRFGPLSKAWCWTACSSLACRCRPNS